MRALTDGFQSATGRYYARLVLSDETEIGAENIVKLTITYSLNGATDRLTLGASPAARLQGTLTVSGQSLLNKRAALYLGRMVAGALEEFPLGVYTITKAPETDGQTAITAYDAMYTALEAGYFPEGAPSTAFAVLRDVAAQAGVSLVLPTGVADVPISGSLSGYTLREMAGYMAALLGCSARMDGEGRLAVQWFAPSGLTVDGDGIYSGGLSLSDTDWTLGRLECSVTASATAEETDDEGNTAYVTDEDTQTFTSGNGATGISFSNPFMTQTALDGIFQHIGGLTYRSGTASCVGDLRYEVGDIVTVVDSAGAAHSLPIMSQTVEYDGGLKMALEAYAESESAGGGEGTSGPLTVALERYTADMASFKKLYAQDLTATNATIQALRAEDADIRTLAAGKADIADLDAANAKIADLEAGSLTADSAVIQDLQSNKASVEDLTATNATLTNVTADVADISALLAGNAGIGNLQAIHLTGDNAVIDDATITDAMIAGLTAGKLTAGTIWTNLVTIASQSGNLSIVDNTIQIVDDAGTVRVQIGKDAAGDYNLALWGTDGDLLWDASGVYAAGLHDGIIKDVAIADDANINQSKIDMQSVAERLNEDGSITVDAGRVTIDDTTLDVAYKTVTGNTAAAQAAADAAQACVDNLQVGGRNLLQESAIYSQSRTIDGMTIAYQGNGWWRVTGTRTSAAASSYLVYGSSAYSGSNPLHTIEAGQYTFGVTGSGLGTDSTGYRIAVIISPTNGTGNTSKYITENSSRTVTLDDGYYFRGINFAVPSTDGYDTIDVKFRVKMEKGTVATDWTPAPEDTEAAITAVTERTTTLETDLRVVQGQITAKVWQSDITAVTDPLGAQVTTLEDNYSALNLTVDGIQTQVGSLQTTTDGLSDRMSVAESTIDQQADQISLKVDKDGVISEINQTAEAVKIQADKINLDGTVLVAGDNGTVTIADGSITAGKINVTDLFAQDITATGTIRGVKIEGATGSFGGVVDATWLKTDNRVGFTGAYDADTSAIYCQWADGDNHDLIVRNPDGLTAAVGWIGSPTYPTVLNLRAVQTNTTGNLAVNGSLTSAAQIGFTGGYNDRNVGLFAQWKDGSNHDLISRNADGLTVNVGWPGSTDYPTVVNLRASQTNTTGKLAVGGALTVSGGATCTGAIYSDAGIVAANSYGFYIKNASGTNVRLINLTSADAATVGHASYTLGLYGSSITASKAITTSSDRRLKHDITPLDTRYDALFDALTPVTYRYNDQPDRTHMGLIYQDVQAALSDCGMLDSALIAEGPDGMGGIAYDELIGLLVREVQMLKARVAALERGE